MNINVTVNLGPEDGAKDGPEEMADAILKACKGDKNKDMCFVQITGNGSVGPMAPAPPVTEPPPT